MISERERERGSTTDRAPDTRGIGAMGTQETEGEGQKGSDL